MRLANSPTAFTSVPDPTTLPADGAAMDTVWERTGIYTCTVRIGARFHKLSAQAGIALPPDFRERLAGYCPAAQTAYASWWYALLFAMSGQLAGQGHGESAAVNGELVLPSPLLLSIEAIRRFRLNTDAPVWPNSGEGQEESENSTKGRSKQSTAKSGKRWGRTPDPEIAKRNKQIAEMHQDGKTVNDIVERFSISADLARKVISDATKSGKKGADREDES